VGIGLDKYLGSHHPIYARVEPRFAQYQLHRMNRKNIVPDCIQAWLVTEFPFSDSVNNLVNQVVYEGKLAYAAGKLMPGEHDSLIFNFTEQELQFCKDNEKQMWTYLIENNLLFVNDKFAIQKFIGEAPFTKGFSSESPGRAVVWLGREIIESYMRKNKDTDLKGLMENNNYQTILNQSGYNP